MNKKKTVWIAVGAVALLIVLAMIFKGGKKEIMVTTDKVILKDITEIVSVTGKIQPETEVKISADVSGEITEMRVKEGDSVTRGQLLLRINPELYETTVSQLQANLNNAKAGLAGTEAQLIRAKASFKQQSLAIERQKKLFVQGVISAQEMETAQAQFEMSKADFEATDKQSLAAKYNVQSVAARLEEGRRNLGRTSIYAPESGIVTNLKSEKGERVVGTAQMAGTEIMRISNLSSMEVQVNVNENDIVRIKLGDSAKVKVDAYDDRVFQGVVTEIANSAVFNQAQSVTDQVTNFVVKIRLLSSSYADLMGKDKKQPFFPGMTASVDIQTQKKLQVAAVPIAAVITREPFSADMGDEKSDSKADNKADDKGGKSKETAKSSDNKSEAAEKVEQNANRIKTWVFVMDNGKAKAVEVVTGIQDMDHFEIISGLMPGDEIITGPSMLIAKTLNDGDKIKLMK